MTAVASWLALALLASSAERVDWMRLRGLNYKTGRVNADAKALDGAVIKIMGYMVPFDDDQNKAAEFLLVPTLGACIHIPAPPPNQLILVNMDAGQRAQVYWDKPVWVEGRLKIETAKGPYGNASYRLLATKVDVYKDY